MSNLILLTFSGAHGTGKTTLASELAAELRKRYGAPAVVMAPSCSSMLFERMRAGRLVLPDEAPMPATYDDIDTFGLRGWFQKHLPSSLAFEVEGAVLRAQERPVKRLFLLVDRWFPDIYAYTHVESSDDKLRAEVLKLCQDGNEALMDYLTTRFGQVKLGNVYVPLAASKFAIVDQDEKFRATCDPQVWEDVCLENWHRVVPQLPSLNITSTSRRGRVTEVMSIVEESVTYMRRNAIK